MKWSRRFRARLKVAIRSVFPPFPPSGRTIYRETNVEGPIQMGGLPSAR